MNRRWLPFLVCFSAALFFNYELVQFHMMSVLGPHLIKDFHLDATDFGTLCATYLLADVIFLLPAGIILDRFSTRRVLLSALFLCILGTIGFAYSKTFFAASCFHFISGIGNAFCFLPCVMLVSRWFPTYQHAVMIGIVITIGMFGGVIGQMPFSYLIEFFSWREALLIDAAYGIVIWILLYFMVQDNAKKIITEDKGPFWKGVIISLKNPLNSLAGIYTSLMNLPLMVIGAAWGTFFLTQVHGFSSIEAPLIISMICMGTIVGSPLFGFFSDRTLKREPWMLLGAILAFSTMLIILSLPTTNQWMFIVLFFLLGLFSSAQVLGYPVITESNPQHLIGTSMGIAAVIIMGLPMLIQPLCGFLLDLGWDGTMEMGIKVYSYKNYLLAFSLFPIGFIFSILSCISIESRKSLANSTFKV